MTQGLPRKVQEELAKAEEIEKAILAGQAQAQAQAQAQEPPEETPEATEELENAETVAEEQAESQEPLEESPKQDVWESKYRALQGKYDIEVPRLHQQNRELLAQIEALQAQVAALSETVQQENKPDAEEPRVRYVTDKDEEEFGPEMIDLSRRVVQEALVGRDAEIAALKNELHELKQQFSQISQQTRRSADETFLDKLDRLVPNWREIDQSQPWLDWLAEVDPITGLPRQAHLDQAHKALDANRVAAIFNTFLETQSPKQTPKSELTKQVSPKKSAAPSTPSTKPKIWTQAEIASALDPRKLKHMTAEEVEKVMSEIDAAQREGRVTL